MMRRGVLAQLLLAACGVWLMAAPAVLDYGDPAATSDRIAGPILVSIGGIAVMAVTRGARWAAVPVAVWLLIAPWVLGFPTEAALSSVVVGLAAAALSQVGGDERGHFGGGWRALIEDDDDGHPSDSERSPAR